MKRHYPLGTGRKLNVQNTFRRRPKLLNVLCPGGRMNLEKEAHVPSIKVNQNQWNKLITN